GFGDAAGNARGAARSAVTADGTMALLGRFTGTLTIGNAIGPASDLDFVAAVRASDGTPLWARQLDTLGGALLGLASSPSASGNRIAFCGKAFGASAFVSGASYGGLSDVVVGVLSSSGTLLWAVQFGGPGNEECDAVAVDDAGNVVATGNFDGASLTVPGTPALTGPGTTSRKFLW